MATCPHCNTENKDNAIFCIHCRKPLPKRSRKPGGTQPIAERVPVWLTELLAKHKEYPAPLIGLEPAEPAEKARMPRVVVEPTGHETDVSALLAQLAEEGAPPPAGDRLASSVEWGAYAETAGPEPPASSLDDFLADLEVTPTESYVQYEPPPVEPARPDADVPAWLTEGLTTPPPQPRPASPPEPELPYDQVPDWLTESSTDFTSPESRAGLQPDLPLGEHDVPEWLGETVKLPPIEQPEPPPQTETELPDWLGDLPSDEGDTGLVEATETGFEAEIPDWISAIVPPASDAFEAEPETGTEDVEAEPSDWNVPDWIAAAQMTDEEEAELAALAPAAAQAGPDWLELEEPAPTESLDLPDWLSPGAPSPAEPKPAAPPTDDAAAWLAELEAAGQSPERSEPAWPGEADIATPALKPPDTAWLVGGDLPTPPPTPPVEPTDAEETAKPRRPLRRLKPLTQGSPEQPPAPSPPGPPDWVAGLVPADFVDEPAGTEPQSLPDWAADLATPAAALPAEAVTPPPDWAQQLVPSGLELEIPPAKPLQKLTPKPDSGPAAPEPDTDIPVLPEDELPTGEAEAGEEIDWIAQFSQALPETREFDAATAELSPEPLAEADELVDERLDWLVGEDESPAEPAEAAPDWLAELAAPASGAEAGADSAIPDWLAELPAPDSEEVVSSLPPTEAEIDRPDWLSELSAAAAAAEPETPAWSFEPSDLPAVEQLEADIGEEELETPAWLAEAAAPTPSSSPAESLAYTDDDILAAEESETPPWLAEAVESTGAVEAEAEIPDWLAELEQPPPTAVEPAPSPLPAESFEYTADEIQATAAGAEEIETPPWLAEAVESTGAVEVEADIPDWLAELHAAPAEAEGLSEPPAVAAEPSDWLTELPEVPTLEEKAAAEPELDVPPWMSELEAVAETEAEETPAFLEEAVADAAEPEVALPDWISALRPAPAGAEEAELPDWLSELEAAPAEADEIAPPDQPVEAAAVPLQMFDAGAPAEPDLPESAETDLPETKEEELPDWLAELPPLPAETDEAELPEWLVGATEPPAITEPLGEAEEEGEADWTRLTGLAASLAVGAAVVATEHEDEVEATTGEMEPAEEPVEWPDWLSELRESPPGEPEPAARVAADEQEVEPPAWLAEESPPAIAAADAEIPAWLSQTPTTTGEAAVAEAGEAEAEPETPDWLAELSAAADAEEITAPPTPDQELAPETGEVGLPDWLSQLRVDSADETMAAGETPEWLAESSPEPQVEMRWAADGASPDWEPAEEAELAEPFAQPQATEEIEELPDWLAELPSMAAAEAPAEPPETETAIPSTVADLLESPAWLADLTPAEAETETDVPDWLAEPAETAAEVELAEETAEPPVEPVMAEETPTETEVELPPWLAELPAQPIAMMAETDSELPPWLAELPAESPEPAETKKPAEQRIATTGWLARLSAPLAGAEADETLAEIPTEELPIEEEVAIPGAPEEAETGVRDWLAELGEDAASEEELVIPDWLTGVAAADTIVSTRWRDSETPAQPALDREQIETDAEAEAPEQAAVLPEAAGPVVEGDLDQALDVAGEPGAPDWLTAGKVTAVLPPLTEERPAPDALKREEVDQVDLAKADVEPAAPLAPPATPPAQARATVSKPKTAEKKRVPGGVDSSVAEADDESLNVAEATGVLVGLSSLLPAQEVMAGATISTLGPQTVGGQKDAVLEAAREFQAIATRVPQPASLPAPLTRRDALLRGGARAGLYLLFIILIAIPLLPALQKLTSSGQPVAWTEPTGSLAEVLDRQRRELISNELGVVDFQQPDSVALVSFDYSPATQGEMQPLADAVIGRLRGQGMRLIFMSLEPEGAAVAQQTLERLLAERNEAYGTNLVNLGYLPGQVVAVRALADGQPLAGLVDPNTGQPFGQGETANWSDIENLAQVDMVVTLADNPTTSRWWIEQLATAVEPVRGERFILAATSAMAQPYLQPYRSSQQLDGLVSGINGAAAIEASRKSFGLARQMLDSQSIAHLLIIILIAAGTMVGWMPPPEQHSA